MCVLDSDPINFNHLTLNCGHKYYIGSISMMGDSYALLMVKVSNEAIEETVFTKAEHRVNKLVFLIFCSLASVLFEKHLHFRAIAFLTC